jgi:hypothetical protein
VVSSGRSSSGSGPGRSACSPKLDSPISLALLERYPSPADAQGLGEQRLWAFLARHHYSGGQRPAELLNRLRRAPEGRVGEAELTARRALVLALVAAIRPLVEQIKQLTEQIAGAVREHPDGEIFLSPFRDRRSVVTAELLAEIADCRARCRPVTRSPLTPARPPSRSSPASAGPLRRRPLVMLTCGCVRGWSGELSCYS